MVQNGSKYDSKIVQSRVKKSSYNDFKMVQKEFEKGFKKWSKYGPSIVQKWSQMVSNWFNTVNRSKMVINDPKWSQNVQRRVSKYCFCAKIQIYLIWKKCSSQCCKMNWSSN